MYVYLAKRFMFQETVIGIEVVMFNNLDDIKYEVVHRRNFNSLRERFKNAKMDFVIGDDDSINCNRSVRISELPTETSIIKEGIIDRSGQRSLYMMIKYLADIEALYLGDPEKLEDVDTSYVPSFGKIRTSNSTMTICISVFDKEKGWRSKNIIYPNSLGQLEQNSFCFAIPIDEKPYEIGCSYIGEILVNGIKFKAFKYEKSLPIIGSCAGFAFCEPLACHLSYQSFVFKSAITAINALKKQISNIDSGDHLVGSLVEADSFNRKFVSRSGVYIDYINENNKKVSSVSANEARDVVKGFLVLLKYSHETSKDVNTEVIKSFVSGSNLSKVWVAILSVIKSIVVIENGEISMKTLDNCVNCLEEYNKLYLNVSLFLYNIRVSCVFEPRVLQYKGLVSSFEIIGSSYRSKARVTII